MADIPFQRCGLAQVHAVMERARRCLYRLVNRHDLHAVQCHLGRDLLVKLVAYLRLARKHQPESGAFLARQPRALVVDDLAILVIVHVLAEVIHVPGIPVGCKEIPRYFDKLPILLFALLQHARSHSVDRFGLRENGNRQPVLAMGKPEHFSGLDREVRVVARRGKVCFVHIERFAPPVGAALALSCPSSFVSSALPSWTLEMIFPSSPTTTSHLRPPRMMSVS